MKSDYSAQKTKAGARVKTRVRVGGDCGRDSIGRNLFATEALVGRGWCGLG